MQSVDLVIADIDWLITVDAGRRIIRDAAIAVRRRQDRRGRQVGRHRRRTIPASPRRRPGDGGDAGIRRLPSAFVVPAVARARGRIQCPVVPVRPHVPLRGRTRQRGRSRVRDPGRRGTAPSHGVTCFIDPGNYHPEASVEGIMSTGIRRRRLALVLRPHQVGARRPSRTDDRDHRRWRSSAPRRCWRNTPSPAIRGSAPAPRSAASTTPRTS